MEGGQLKESTCESTVSGGWTGHPFLSLLEGSHQCSHFSPFKELRVGVFSADSSELLPSALISCLPEQPNLETAVAPSVSILIFPLRPHLAPTPVISP